jgi:fused signal recognition particle receptor
MVSPISIGSDDFMFKGGFFKNVFQKIDQFISGRGKKIDEALFEELEEALISADLNVHTALKIMETLREQVKTKDISEAEDVKGLLRDAIVATLTLGEPVSVAELHRASKKPTVYLVVGVNGVGKTTSIAKMAYRFKNEGAKVVLAAADTFRAAAIDQLQIWGSRLDVEVVTGKEGSDPASVVFDAIKRARDTGADYVICDTAGRMHTKRNLMEELKKINRVIIRERGGGAADETLLVLDASTGQNALFQAQEFKKAVDFTGIILSKLDGTAKGGIVVTIKEQVGAPIKLIGTGEKPEDMEEFNPEMFVNAIFEPA